jgi:hypothetical protein
MVHIHVSIEVHYVYLYNSMVILYVSIIVLFIVVSFDDVSIYLFVISKYRYISVL